MWVLDNSDRVVAATSAAAVLSALAGAFALVVHYFWLVGDLNKSLFFCCVTTASEELLQQAAAAAAFEFVFGLVDLKFVPESDREVGQYTASSLIVGIEDQASRRVDVPGGVTQLASAASQVFGKVPGQFETEHEVHQTNCEIGENATFQVLVKQFSDQHLAVSVTGWGCLQLRSLVPAEAFQLVKAGRHLDSCRTLREEKLLAGDTVHMCGRLKSGSSNFASHADWYCVACGRGGCWASRLQCYRCGFPRIESEKLLAGMPPGRGQRRRQSCRSRCCYASQGNAVLWQICRATDVIMSHLAAPQATESQEN